MTTDTVIANVERFLAQQYAKRPTPVKLPTLHRHEKDFLFTVFCISAALGACLNMVLK